MLRIASLLAALFAALSVAACGSSNDKGGSGSATKDTSTVVVTSTTKSGATKTTTVNVPSPGKLSTVKPTTARERGFVAGLNRRCVAAIGSTRSIAAPTTSVTSARAYARRATPAVKRTIAVLRSSHPAKSQVVAVATLVGSYGQTITLLKTLNVSKGPRTEDAQSAAQNLAPTLKRVRVFATAAALPSCRPPGL